MADAKTVFVGKIVAAYLRGNSLAISEIPDLIHATYAALVRTESPEPQTVEHRQPAVSIKKSVTPEAIICLSCGKSQKTLKRHLRAAHGLTVGDYRIKWGLSSDYPVVAPAYAQHRSQLALKIGLGREKALVGVDKPTKAEATATKPQHQYPPSRWSCPAD